MYKFVGMPNDYPDLTKKFFLEIDLFAWQMNKQLDKYVSWQPGPHSRAVDTFNLSWENCIFMLFHLLALLGGGFPKLSSWRDQGS